MSFEYRTDQPITRMSRITWQFIDFANISIKKMLKKYIPIQCCCVMHGLIGPENQHGIKFAERRAGYGITPGVTWLSFMSHHIDFRKENQPKDL